MYILLTVLIVAILWFVLKPKWAPKPPDTAVWTGKASAASKQATAKASAASKQATAKAGQMYQGLRGRLKFRNDTRDLAKQFKQWVAEAAPAQRAELYSTLPASAEGFATGLAALSDKDLQLFVRKLARFCASLNFDLAWLNDPQISREPELKKAVEDAVLLYSLTVWRANTVQQDVKGFFAYRAWLANPNRYRAFGQKLYSVLVQRGVVTIPSDLYLAPEKERLAQAATTIRKLYDEDHDTFHAALRQVVEDGQGATAVTPAPAPAAAPPQPVQPKLTTQGATA